MSLLTHRIVIAFFTHYSQIMTGHFHGSLIAKTPESIESIIVNSFKEQAERKIYKDHHTMESEVGCKTTLAVLLKAFLSAAERKCHHKDQSLSSLDHHVLGMMSGHTRIEDDDDLYTGYLKVLTLSAA